MFTLDYYNNKRYLSSIGLMILSSICIAMIAFIAKYLMQSLYLPLLIFLRFFMPCLVTWWIASIIGFSNRTFSYHHFYTIRACLVFLSQYAFFYCLFHSSLMNATVLLMTSPLFVPLIERFKNNQTNTRFTWIQWVSVIIGFIGIVLIVKPVEGAISWPTLIGVVAGFLNACSQVLFHQVSKKTDPMTISLWHYSICSFIAFLGLLVFFKHIPWEQVTQLFTNDHLIILLIASAIVGVSNQFLRSRAYHKVENIMGLSVFLYFSVIFSGILDWSMFGIYPDITSLTGAILISISGIMMLNCHTGFFKINALLTTKRE